MRFGILQYVPIQIVCAIITFSTQLAGKWTGTRQFAMNVAYPYVAFVTNCSQIWAMYCLVLFYEVLHEDLKPIKPLAKFVSVKSVVFFTFWQSVIISALVDINWIHSTSEFSTDEISAGLQDIIICFEMVIAAIVHIYIFPPKEFHDPSNVERYGMGGRINTFLNPQDIVKDMHKHILVAGVKDMKKTGKKVLHKNKREPNKNGVIDPIELGIASDAFEQSDKEDSDSDTEIQIKDKQSPDQGLGTELVRIQSSDIAPPDETISSAIFISPQSNEQENRQDRPLIF